MKPKIDKKFRRRKQSIFDKYNTIYLNFLEINQDRLDKCERGHFFIHGN